MKHVGASLVLALALTSLLACTGGDQPPTQTADAGADTQSPLSSDGGPRRDAAAAADDAAVVMPHDAGGDGGALARDAGELDTPELSGLVTIEEGELPIVLSAPHGGEESVPDVAARTSPGAVVTLDFATYELALGIQERLVALTGKRAHLVAARASREYIDFNRDAPDAYESPAAAPIYDAYHAALARAVTAAKARSSAAALLVDVHGQSALASLALRGTRNGQTAELATLHAEPSGFLTVLLEGGIEVSPSSSSAFVLENPSFNGGFIVGTHGLSGEGKINAVQLELGLDYREPPSAMMETATKVADALVAHLEANGAL